MAHGDYRFLLRAEALPRMIKVMSMCWKSISTAS